MKRLNALIYRALQGLLALLMIVLMIPVILQIGSRLTEATPHYPWTEEAARFLFIWIIMIGAAIAVRDGSHFHLDVLPKPKTQAGKVIARLIVHAAMLIMALTFVAFGWQFALFGNDQESDLLGLNMLWIHIAWPGAGVVFTLFLLEKLVADVKRPRRDGYEPR
ncbi:MAG TPA: TRAP transporter small permease [Burkholderiales bacterium]|nr:TRAP transporter small permease [Burkholderiales bacterium]